MLSLSPPASFRVLLDAMRSVHATHGVLSSFCDFPDDLIPQSMVPVHRPCADVMVQGLVETTPAYDMLCRSMLAAGGDAQWRETYAGTDVGQDFMNRFGCYCIIGSGGAWVSRMMSAYLVYMPPGLWYPWHQHPAEEMYLVVGGEAEFLRKGAEPETLRPGDTVLHASDQPHATRTTDQPLLALVLWRNNLGIKPILTPPGEIGDVEPVPQIA